MKRLLLLFTFVVSTAIAVAAQTELTTKGTKIGEVILKVEFLASGKVGAISVVKGLTNGLTEQAIAAAKAIKFKPVQKNGQAVTVTKHVAYSFTLIETIETITADQYNGPVDKAVKETNQQFPFTFTVITEELANGKLVSTETEIRENQSQGFERRRVTVARDGKTTVSYLTRTGPEKVYCSNDGITWEGPQEPECYRDLYGWIGSRTPEISDYSVEETMIDGKNVKVYRKYVVYPPIEPGLNKRFNETLATIDSRGLFISVVNNEGTLDPKNVTLIRKQIWDLKTRFEPVVAPK